MVAGGMAFDDSWIPALLEANPLPGLRELTLRMDSDHYVEEGFLTRTSLQTLLSHATTHCPRLEKVGKQNFESNFIFFIMRGSIDANYVDNIHIFRPGFVARPVFSRYSFHGDSAGT